MQRSTPDHDTHRDLLGQEGLYSMTCIYKLFTSPFHHTGWLYLVNNNNLFVLVYGCGEADAQTG